jgi:hypothetical protein
VHLPLQLRCPATLVAAPWIDCVKVSCSDTETRRSKFVVWLLLQITQMDRHEVDGAWGIGRDGTKTFELCNRLIILDHNNINLVVIFMHYNKLIT